MLIATARADAVTMEFCERHGVEMLPKPYNPDGLTTVGRLTNCTRVSSGRSCFNWASGKADSNSFRLNAGTWKLMGYALLDGRRERSSVSQPLAPGGLSKRCPYSGTQFLV